MLPSGSEHSTKLFNNHGHPILSRFRSVGAGIASGCSLRKRHRRQTLHPDERSMHRQTRVKARLPGMGLVWRMVSQCEWFSQGSIGIFFRSQLNRLLFGFAVSRTPSLCMICANNPVDCASLRPKKKENAKTTIQGARIGPKREIYM